MAESHRSAQIGQQHIPHTPEKQVSVTHPDLKYMYQLYGDKCCHTVVTVTGKHGSNYRLSLSCNRKSKKLNLTNLFNSQQ